MPGYGVDTSIPNGANPSQAPQPVPQTTPPPAASAPPSQGIYNTDEAANSFAKIPDQQPTQGPPQFSTTSHSEGLLGTNVDAIGSASQIAQANIGRNVNERLQIWSKMVGDNNAVIGPNNDVWIRGQDSKFHPADSDHTSILQDLAKKSGAGIDTVAMAVSDLAGQALGTGAGFLAGGGPGAAIGQKVGYIAGLAAGPGVGSLGRQYLATRYYGIQPDKEQVKRDMLVGGAMNVFMGGMFSGMGFGPKLAESGLVGTVLDKIGQGSAESAPQRAVRIARAQMGAKQFFDSVGATPNPAIGENGAINTSISQAGQNIMGAVDAKRTQLNTAIENARNIITSSPGKPNTLPLAQGIRSKLLEEGIRFDDHGMPINPSERIPITASPVTNDVWGPKDNDLFATTPGNVVGSTTRRSVMQSSPAVDQLMDDYKACVSGQMDKESYLDMIRNWQSQAKFKVFETRPDQEVATWRKLQNMGVENRDQMINQSLAGSPDDLAKVQKAYSDYRSTVDALNLTDQAFKNAKNSPEKLAETFFQPGQTELMTQFQSAFKDNPKLLGDARSAWLSNIMSNHVNDGVFNSATFLKQLNGMGGEFLNQVFKPEELASLKRSASIMGAVKSNDLVSQAQGDSVASAAADFVSKARTNTGAVLKWFQDKPKYADFVSRAGSEENLAGKTISEDPAAWNTFKTQLRNWTVGQKVLSNNPSIRELATNSQPFNLRQMSVAGALPYTGNMKRIANTLSPVVGGPTQAQPVPQGSTGPDAAASEVFK